LLTYPTADLLVKLGLGDMARAFAELQDNPSAARLGHAEWLALLLEREASERSNRRLTDRLRHAKLRQRATIEDIDWRAQRGLDRSLFQRLIAGDSIERRRTSSSRVPPASARRTSLWRWPTALSWLATRCASSRRPI
jgi:DNA replication protein DnaC